MEFTECLQIRRYYRTIISEYSSEEKSNKDLSISEDFSAHDLH